MHVFLSAFWLPKAGNSKNEYEDAFYPEKGGERRGNMLRFAVADGASEALLSGEWARILVRAFCREAETDSCFLGRSTRSWDKWKGTYLSVRQRQGRPIQWFEEPGLQAGAFSTLLGLVLMDSEEESHGRWTAVAVGDSCVFQVRGEALIGKFPMDHSTQFDIQPFLLSSGPAGNRRFPEVLRRSQGDWHRDDRFYLMTDALACWFLRTYEAGDNPWAIPRDLDTRDAPLSFTEWMGELRGKKQLRNDDITLIRIDIM
ncbi:MAG: protein phosphatase 2C domain-containing protein [Chloroflexi bacterium]|nr:protein phosphatase 2C domain-containing protein [Chloroflexota bacterium]